jgi:hypothetical protein
MPIMKWLHYADHGMAPLRRSVTQLFELPVRLRPFASRADGGETGVRVQFPMYDIAKTVL